MRSNTVQAALLLTVLPALIASTSALAGSGEFDYAESRALTLDARPVQTLRIHAGAGSMSVSGDPSTTQIAVNAMIQINGARGEDVHAVLDTSMRLSLEHDGATALLISDFETGMTDAGNATIDLEIIVPQGTALDIEDGSGSIEISRTLGSVRLEDGSGSVSISGAADVVIDDGSGSIRIDTVSGNVSISDGSGSIAIRQIGGDVAIDDGSGSIDVRDVVGDFVVADSGSGRVKYDGIAGNVVVDDW